MKVIKIEHKSEMLLIDKEIIVIRPDKINEDTKVLTLLHGGSDNASAFLYFTFIANIAEKHNLFIILPDAIRSYYTNLAMGYPYMDYISEEIYDVVDETLQIGLANRKQYIGGFSMGGYGAIKIALNSERYDGVFSMSGILDMKLWDENKRKTDEGFFLKEWQQIMGETLAPKEDLFTYNIDKKYPLHLIVGKHDFLYEHTIKFHEQYKNETTLEIDEEGDHNWFFVNRNLEKIIVRMLEEK